MISEFQTNGRKILRYTCALLVALVGSSVLQTGKLGPIGQIGNEVFAQRVRFGDNPAGTRGDSFVIPNGQIAPPLIRNTAPVQTAIQRPPTFPVPNARPAGFPQQIIPGQTVTLPPNINTQPILPTLQNPFPNGGTTFPVQQVPMLPPAQIPGGYPNIPNGQAPTIRPPAIQQPTFDPFAVQNGAPPMGMPQGGYPGPGIVPGPIGGGLNQPVQPPPFIYPPPSSGANLPPAGTYNVPQQYPGLPGYPGSYPGYPGNGNGSWGNSAAAWPSQTWARLRSSQVYRLLERPRWRHTYLAPDAFSGSRGLGLNETDIATTLSIPNFLYSSQPIRISPGFIFHFWDGPDTVTTGADLPGQTYSVYLANDFSTPWNRQLGAEVNLTVGLYTDFQEVTTDSIRLTGVGLGWYRLNNTTTFKAGIEYLDRVRVKLLPAVGFFIYPTQDLKLDLYFPRPKIAQRLPNLGNNEVWGYIGGEYGAGSWTIKRAAGMGDQADVNDIRAFVGLEWMGPRQVTGFFEAGYVFDREIIYKSAPNTEIDIDDTFMLRAGLAF